jgi:AraC family transcriptional regulator, transcriptional activator of pobA
MPKKNIPLFNIQQHCHDSGIADFKVGSFSEDACTAAEFEEGHRHEYFEIIWLKNGTGNHQIDLQDHTYTGSVMFLLAPGQIHKIEQQVPSEGYIIKFLPSIFKHEKDFFNYILDTCLFDDETTCSVIKIPDNLRDILEELFVNMVQEFHQIETDSENIVSSYLKILITHINRIKRKKISESVAIKDPQYALFRQFKIEIEKKYKKEHSVQYYAGVLHTQPRSLNAVSREYAGKSAGEMIQDRILLEAQRYLYHDAKSIKEIGYDLGFDDPAYFTRFFKKHTGSAPQYFKEQRILAASA